LTAFNLSLAGFFRPFDYQALTVPIGTRIGKNIAICCPAGYYGKSALSAAAPERVIIVAESLHRWQLA
jgi:hypothetical protein